MQCCAVTWRSNSAGEEECMYGREHGMPERVVCHTGEVLMLGLALVVHDIDAHLPTNGHQWSWKDTKHNDMQRIRMYVCNNSFDELKEKKNPLLTKIT